MKYSLIVDLGNSQTELAVFDENNLIDKIRFETDKINSDYDNRKIKQFLSHLGIDGKDFEGGMIFSVVPHLTRLVQIILKVKLELILRLLIQSRFLHLLNTMLMIQTKLGKISLLILLGLSIIMALQLLYLI